MRPHIRCALIFVCATAPASAQISLSKGLPFEATRTRTFDYPATKSSSSGKVARSSNGSQYEEITDPKTGELILVNILDLPNRRSIVLDVKHHWYSIQPFAFPTLSDPPSAEALQRYLESSKQAQPAHTTQDGYETETTPLGFRTENGFQEFGRRTRYDQLPPTSKLRDKVWEDWYLPALQITVEKISYDADNKPTSITRLSDIQTKEPNPQLFEIPAGYTPLSEPSQK